MSSRGPGPGVYGCCSNCSVVVVLGWLQGVQGPWKSTARFHYPLVYSFQSHIISYIWSPQSPPLQTSGWSWMGRSLRTTVQEENKESNASGVVCGYKFVVHLPVDQAGSDCTARCMLHRYVHADRQHLRCTYGTDEAFLVDAEF